MLYVKTSKGWFEAKFRCSNKLQGIERDVLKASFFITARHGRLFGDPDDWQTWGTASAYQITEFLGMDQTEANLKKVRMVLKFLRSLTWVQLKYRARAGTRNGATAILVSKACYRLSKYVSDSVSKIRTIYEDHIWGSGSDFEVKPKSLQRGLREVAEALGYSGPMVRRMV